MWDTSWVQNCLSKRKSSDQSSLSRPERLKPCSVGMIPMGVDLAIGVFGEVSSTLFIIQSRTRTLSPKPGQRKLPCKVEIIS